MLLKDAAITKTGIIISLCMVVDMGALTGVAYPRRNNQWVNPYNTCIATAIGSNHDLSFISTRAKSLALLYYITNYSTKDEEKKALEKGLSKFSL
jgi:hypothetical protein